MHEAGANNRTVPLLETNQSDLLRAPNSAAKHSLHPLWELTRTRLRLFIREPEAVFWVFVFPILLSCALGLAFRSSAPEKVRVAIENDGPQAVAMASALGTAADTEAFLLSPADAAQALRSGRVALVVVAGASSGARQDSTAPAISPGVDYRYDPARPESRLARLTVDNALQRSMGRADVTTSRDQKVTEPGARYIDFLIPGLVGMNLMGSGIWGVGFAIVQSRGRKLLKRFAVTPMRRSHYLLAFMFSRLLFMVVEVVTVVGFGWLVFGVAVRGSIFSLLVVAMLGAVMFGSLGLLIAARPQTVEGVTGLMNFIMMPMWLLSGTFFSPERFPKAILPVIKILPLTALNDGLRSVMSDAAPLSSNWPQLVIMLAWCSISFVLAVRMFRWQ